MTKLAIDHNKNFFLILRGQSDTGGEGASARGSQHSMRLAFTEVDGDVSDGDEEEDALFEQALGESKAGASSGSSARAVAAAASRRTVSGSGNESTKTK